MNATWAALVTGTCSGAGLGIGAASLAGRLTGRGFVFPAWPFIVADAALAVWAVELSATPWLAVVSILLSGCLLTLAVVDVSVLRLPDAITLPLVAAGIGMAAVCRVDVLSHCVGAMVGFSALFLLALAFRRFRGRDGIGMGDAKLLAAAGAWLGWAALPWMVLVSCGLAFAWVAARWLRRGRESLTQPLPFGAPLAAGFWLVWLYGAPPP